MHVAHLILTERLAGSERYAIELANAQVARHQVSLILRRGAVGSHPGALLPYVDPGVRVILVNDWLARWQARRVLRRLRPDVAHAHLSVGCKSLHGLEGLCLRVGTLHIRYKAHQHAGLDALVAIAPWQLNDIPAPLRAHTAQIDNWTQPHPPAANARARLRQQHDIPEHAWVFGALGRIESSKGFDVLVQAFEQAALPDAYLVIVGEGGALDGLRRRAGPRVIFPGFSSTPQDWLAAFDGFVSSARSEPFGLVLLEAMQAGLPILATRSQGTLHLAETMQPTLLPIDDVAAMTQALRDIARRRPVRREYAMAGYDLAARLDQFDTFYEHELTALGTPFSGGAGHSPADRRRRREKADNPEESACSPHESLRAHRPSIHGIASMNNCIVELLAKDLNPQGGVFCPNPQAGMQLWSSHPRVYLDVGHDGAATCPYCGTVYQLRPGEHLEHAGH